jgi:hypothetical protein
MNIVKYLYGQSINAELIKYCSTAAASCRNVVIPLVVAIERGIAQTNAVSAVSGLKDR